MIISEEAVFAGFVGRFYGPRPDYVASSPSEKLTSAAAKLGAVFTCGDQFRARLACASRFWTNGYGVFGRRKRKKTENSDHE